jgi:GNAT superfamily N-acetyltransferase
MPQMTDPSAALQSFQLCLETLALQRCKLHSDVFLLVDQPNGSPRFTYALLDRATVTALAILAVVEPQDGVPCFQIGYAVAENFRRRGLARKLVTAAIAELRHGLSRNGISNICVEAVVGTDNIASQRVAAATICATPTNITDSVSGLPALYYCNSY